MTKHSDAVREAARCIRDGGKYLDEDALLAAAECIDRQERQLRIARRNEARWQAKCARQAAVIREMHERLSVTRLANIQLRAKVKELEA